jgi:hypothetical protein
MRIFVRLSFIRRTRGRGLILSFTWSSLGRTSSLPWWRRCDACTRIDGLAHIRHIRGPISRPGGTARWREVSALRSIRATRGEVCAHHSAAGRKRSRRRRDKIWDLNEGRRSAPIRLLLGWNKTGIFPYLIAAAWATWCCTEKCATIFALVTLISHQ